MPLSPMVVPQKGHDRRSTRIWLWVQYGGGMLGFVLFLLPRHGNNNVEIRQQHVRQKAEKKPALSIQPFDSNSGDEKTDSSTISLDVQASTSKSDTVPTVYSRMRKDRVGAAIQDMLMAHAFAFSEDIRYGGVCIEPTPEADLSVRSKNSEAHNQDVITQTKSLLETLGLDDILPFACPLKRGDILLRSENYNSHDTSLFTESWLSSVQKHVKYNNDTAADKASTEGKSVVVHVRRGDVDPCSHQNRYLPNSHYVKVLDRLVNEDPTINEQKITVFSEKESFESWESFKGKTDYKLDFDGDLPLVWMAMINADILVMSRSSFSLVPAVLCRGTVVYTPFWHSPLKNWRVVDEDIVKSIRPQVNRLKKRCP